MNSLLLISLVTTAVASSSMAHATAAEPCIQAVTSALTSTHPEIKLFQVGVGSPLRRFNYHAAYKIQGQTMLALLAVDPVTCEVSEIGFFNPQ